MAAQLSGQVTVTTAGTAVQATAIAGTRFVIKALPANTGVMYIGSDGSGDVASTNGFPLSANEAVELTLPDTLAALWVDASVNGEKVAWLRVE